MNVKIGEKFSSLASGKKIRVLNTSTSFGVPIAIVATLKANNHRVPGSTRAVYVDSIRRKYTKV